MDIETELLYASRMILAALIGGFIGAGVIFQDKGGVAGLTTAATLWATAAVGMASAFGMSVLAIITGGLIFATLALHHLIKSTTLNN